MQLPEVGSLVAVQFKRNPAVYSDAALNPRLHFGRVVRHEGTGGFTAALGNYDHLPQESWLEWDEENQQWDDRDFHQPIEWVKYPVTDEMEKLTLELEALPEEIPEPEGGTRPFDEMRLRFLLGALEDGWLDAVSEPLVLYSDDLPDPNSTVSRWQRQKLGRCQVDENRIELEWPVEERDPADWALVFERRPGGEFYCRSEAFGDEFEARLEQRGPYRLLMGLWGSEEFVSFFAAVLP